MPNMTADATGQQQPPTPTNPPPVYPFRPEGTIGALRPADIPTVGINDPRDSRIQPEGGTDDQG